VRLEVVTEVIIILILSRVLAPYGFVDTNVSGKYALFFFRAKVTRQGSRGLMYDMRSKG
jgi:hypothetical protein